MKKEANSFWAWSNVCKDEGEIDDEIRQINIMRDKLGKLPKWASDIRQQIGCISPCGHYSFPEQIDLICKGIGKKKPQSNFRGCYQVSSEIKKRMEVYLFSLESWLNERDIDSAVSERPIYERLIRKIYSALDIHSELKKLLVTRLIKRHQWWLYVIPLDTWDTRSAPYSWYNEPHGVDLFRAEYKNPEIEKLEKKICKKSKEKAEIFLSHILHSWLCHYKVFRYIEIAIDSIGREVWRRDNNQQGSDRAKMIEVRGKYIKCFDHWLDGRNITEAVSEMRAEEVFVCSIYSMLGICNDFSFWLVNALRKTMKIFKEWEVKDLK